MSESLKKAREVLREWTPLRSDCGRICGAACCSSLAGEETGMLLFPGEETMLGSLDGWSLRKAGPDLLALCPGTCDRALRPLACRLFPLLPVIRGNEIRVETDLRARAVCPLARQGKDALLPAFIEAVRQAGTLLMEDPEQRAFLERLSLGQEELRALKRAFRKEANPCTD